ncbi:hypothetical protein GBAR_LOCUS22751, partial [Geodia barretti]
MRGRSNLAPPPKRSLLHLPPHPHHESPHCPPPHTLPLPPPPPPPPHSSTHTPSPPLSQGRRGLPSLASRTTHLPPGYLPSIWSEISSEKSGHWSQDWRPVGLTSPPKTVAVQTLQPQTAQGQKGFMFRTNTMGTQPQRSVSPKSPCKQKQKQQQTLLDDVIYDLGNATKLSQRYKLTAIILSFCAYHLCHRVVVALD